MDVELTELYTAYRKAKREAFADPNCAHGRKFAVYEQNLSSNLARLRRRLMPANSRWSREIDFIGRVTCIPKSVSRSASQESEVIHFQSSDPLEQWERECGEGERATADFRPIIDATVDFMIVSALWILKVGHLYDEKLDTRYVVGNRLKRWRPEPDAPRGTPGPLNELSPDLFQPYFTAYGRWRTEGLKVMRRELREGRRIVAITMDLQRFYHQIDARFLLRDDYLDETGIELTDDQREFTTKLIEAFSIWNDAAHEELRYDPRGLPVGITASSLIANVLLREFDRKAVAELNPAYYSRYVDDVFLVVPHSESFSDGRAVLEWLDERMGPIVTATFSEDENEGSALEVHLPYADGSKLLFVGKKQKIFQLEGQHGIDLIGPIEEQIRQQTSEHRDMPSLPDTEKKMAHRALLVTPDATLNADALRKADAVTLRRSGFSMLLGDVEAHARDLDAPSWSQLRLEFYGLVLRHMLTPTAFFDYSRYFPRIVGVMAVCGDWEHAERFIRRFRSLRSCLLNTCKPQVGKFRPRLRETFQMIGARIGEAILQAVPCGSAEARDLLRQVQSVFAPTSRLPTTISRITTVRNQFLELDWSRTSYAAHWLTAQTGATSRPRPRSPQIRSLLPFDAMEVFREEAGLPVPYWPALAFPTRPVPLRDIMSRAPTLLREGGDFHTVVRGLRGTWMPEFHGLDLDAPEDGPWRFSIPYTTNWRPRIAITSIEVSDEEWAAAADGTPSLTLERYRKLNDILDSIVACRQRPNYVILPECSLPRRWAMNVASRLLHRGISLIAGLEYRPDSSNPDLLHNEALVALRTTFPGYLTGLYLLQPKRQPAWHERQLLSDQFGKQLAPSALSLPNHPVYRHQGFQFGVLICSELTDIQNRLRYQGAVDALFIPEWNQDIESFSALVESAALDVHAYIVQANNRKYGDGRMRAPMKIRYRRDMIRITGGINDYFVVEEIDYMALRRFQSNAVPPTGEGVRFKPFPVGFPARLDPSRRAIPSG